MRLAGAVLALSLALAWPSAVGDAAAQDAAASPNPLAGLKLGDFGSTLSQPLFTPTRTAPIVEVPVEAPPVVVEAAPPPVEEPPPPPPFKLVGVVLGGTDEVAILADESTGQVHRLNSGDDLDGWTMDVLDNRTVEFENAEQSVTLTMFEEFEAPPAYAGYQQDDWVNQQGYGQDARAGEPAIDPNTGLPIDPDTGLPTDPETNQAYDPNTGYPIDPNTGYPTDPDTGQAYDPNSGYPVDPYTGQPIDPNTGQPIDPNTGEPIDTGSIP